MHSLSSVYFVSQPVHVSGIFLVHRQELYLYTEVLINPKPHQAEKTILKCRHFSSDAEVIAAAETWLDGQYSEFFLSDLQKLEFGLCSLFPSRSG